MILNEVLRIIQSIICMLQLLYWFYYVKIITYYSGVIIQEGIIQAQFGFVFLLSKCLTKNPKSYCPCLVMRFSCTVHVGSSKWGPVSNYTFMCDCDLACTYSSNTHILGNFCQQCLSVCLLVFLYGSGDQIQGSVCGRQVLYQWATTSSPRMFCLKMCFLSINDLKDRHYVFSWLDFLTTHNKL